MKVAEYAKRACDIGAAIVGLTLFAPTFLIAALAIKLDSRGPIFVHKVQFGPDNRAIRLFKFRVATCTKDSEMDWRLTRIGRILGKTNIDELPQLINLLRGQISIFSRRESTSARGVGLGEYGGAG